MTLETCKQPNQNQGVRPTAVSMDKIAHLCAMHRTTILRRSEKESWAFEEESIRGGRKKLFPIKTLPIDIRKKVMIALGELPAEFAELVPVEFDRTKIANCAKEFDRASSWQKELAKDRLAIIQALDTFRRQYTGRRSLAVQGFVDAYLGRYIEGLDPAIFSRIPVVKRSRLYDWESRFRQRGVAGLISEHGCGHKGAYGFPMEQQQFVLGTLANNPNLKSYQIQRSLQARFGEAAKSRRQVADFLKRRMTEDPVMFAYLKDPDAAKGKYQLALGSASEKAQRFLHYIEVDSTPADLLCADGKRYNIIGGIDIFSRKAKFVVTKTSNSWGIAGLIRQIATDWGVPEKIVRDNGQDYASNMVNDGLVALNIEVCKVPPFTPEAKPHIERVFRTLSHDLLETLPGYIGHNVAERKAIENRRSFAERLGKSGRKISPKGRNDRGTCRNDTGAVRNGLRLATTGETMEMSGTEAAPTTTGLTPEELQAAINRWTEDVYHQRKHSSLGMSPNAKASTGMTRNRRIADKRALDILLAPSGERMVGKKGLRYDSGLFWGDALVDYIGQKVLCRLDIWDASRIFCFEPVQQGFICEAVDMALTGMTLGEKIGARKRAKKRANERVRAIKQLGDDADPLADEMALIRQSRATIANLPTGEMASNPFIEGAMEAIRAEDLAKQREEELESTAAKPIRVGDFEDMEYQKQRHEQIYEKSGPWRAYETERQKVSPLISKNQELIERKLFSTPAEKFEYHRLANQMGYPTEEKAMTWLRKYLDRWFMYAVSFREGWHAADKRWLMEIAPHRFGPIIEQLEQETK